ncbi:MAG: sulfatase-like hydrolase/transferase, partial [bacterium]
MQKFQQRYISLPPAVLAVAALTGFRETAPGNPPAHPNILLIMVDQMQTPPEGYGPTQGAVQDMKEILSFRPVSPGNSYSPYFEGFLRLQQNGVVMKKHYTASAASVPSRCCIMTGQYPTVTNVTQTDGMFKSAQDVPFLDPDGTPTIGDWLRQLGYTTHYFGKWHVSELGPPSYLQPWGFSDWAISYPEPHGGSADNLGVYRDVVFANHVVNFLEKQGTNPPATPWFTVASLVDPHDVSSWPSNWQVYDTNGVVPWVDYPPPLTIPATGDNSLWGTVSLAVNYDTISKAFRVPLNPDGFPENNAFLPPTFDEQLDKKPDCQYDYSFKMGLAFGTNIDYTFKKIGDTVHHSPHPFQLQGSDYAEWCRNYARFYFYCQYLADLQIRRILKALDDSHLTENTIVVFISDHGEMAGAHGGMIQKWHNAYEESVRVPMVISSPLVNSSAGTLREIVYPTSSIDLVPTLIGLAGYNPDSLLAIPGIIPGHSPSAHFPGVNLSGYIKG